MQRSPLAPVAMPVTIPVAGVKWSSAATGMRYKGRDDLGLIAFSKGSVFAGVFTKSTTAGHPIAWCREQLYHGQVSAIVINAGNANVFRGETGDRSVRLTVDAVAAAMNCPNREVLVASTGVIGEHLDAGKLAEAVPSLASGLRAEAMPKVASAIMTTDTFPKWTIAQASIDGVSVRIAGIAKGSGMIAPDLATMLAFIVTDANLTQSVLQELLNEGAENSFNSITVDGDTSTSDMVLLCATGASDSRPIEKVGDPALASFRQALHQLMQELATLVVRDGEGASKFITINVTGATTDDVARVVGKSIANSLLVKTALAGEDANWGRIIMAIGKSGAPVDIGQIGINLGGYPMARHGQAVEELDEGLVSEHLAGYEIVIDVIVGRGVGQATIWTCDLTHRYIDINADYRS